MRPGRRQLEAEERARDRREREDSAPRLKDEVSNLVSLSIEIDGNAGAGTTSATRYTRHVVVQRAPALFDIPCSEQSCENGGHDVTRLILDGLRDGLEEFSGEDACAGWRGNERCDCVLKFQAHAKYSK